MGQPQKARVLGALLDGQPVVKACEEAGVARSTVYRWRDEDETFRATWDTAYEQGTDLLELEAQRRAVDGVDDFKVGPNGQFVEMRKYSDTLLIFLLKARRPHRYRDNATVELTGPEGGPVQVEDRSASLNDVARVLVAVGAIPQHSGGAAEQPLPDAPHLLSDPPDG